MVGNFADGKVTGLNDIMADEPFEAPMKPFGGVESFAWHPDSRQLVYVSRKKTGLEYAISTNSDLYLYDLASGSTRNLTEGMMGYDTMPAFSPDGKHLAWLSMEHDGYESDKNRLFILDLATAEKRDLTTDWDYSIDQFAWAPEGTDIFFIAPKDGVIPVFRLRLKDCAIAQLTAEQADYTTLQPAGKGRVVTMSHSMLRPNELMLVAEGKKKNEETRLTHVNDYIFDQMTMPTVERRMVATTDGKQMLVWVVKPPKFDEGKKYPALLYCQGGPQQPVSQFWSYRWNLALMAANGYVVIAPNRRGLPGFGTEWNAQISKDYPGQNMRDYLAAVDDLKKEAWIDDKHIGATGASYGRFLDLLPGRQPRRPLRRLPCPRRHIQHGAAISRDRRDVVCQLGHGRSLLGERQHRRPAHLRQLAPPLCRPLGHAHHDIARASTTTASSPARAWPPSTPPSCAAYRPRW